MKLRRNLIRRSFIARTNSLSSFILEDPVARPHEPRGVRDDLHRGSLAGDTQDILLARANHIAIVISRD